MRRQQKDKCSPYLQPLPRQPSWRGRGGGDGCGAGSAPERVAAPKESIVFVVRELRGLGLAGPNGTALSAEILRKAKFDKPEAVGVLRRVLHDLVLLQLAGFPRDAERALLSFWRKAEASEIPEDLPPPAAAMLQNYLAEWGCPLQPLLLGGRAGSGAVSSRLLLLCLGWLIAHTQALEAALQHRLNPPDRPDPSHPVLFPPWPQDEACLADSLAAAAAASRSAAAFARELCGVPASGAGWPAVEAKQHSALMLFGRVRALAMGLGALQQARYRRMVDCGALQRRLHGLSGKAPPVLTPFELSLATDSARCGSVCEQLEAEASADEEMAAAARHASTFFSWLDSVREELQHHAPRPLLAAASGLVPDQLAAVQSAVARGHQALSRAVPEAVSILRESPPQPSSNFDDLPAATAQRPTLPALQLVACETLAQTPDPGRFKAPAVPPLAEGIRERAEQLRQNIPSPPAAPSSSWVYTYHQEGDSHALEASGLAPVTEELAKLRRANLCVAKRIAALRASSKKRLNQAGSSLQGPTDALVFKL
mmetsp:Transcript_13923/g.39408  ORF Transcript_13923/g.39408 Transcript_13923/m.39408 type:complete len:540 (+) Transcript_13923:228-1847(+)